MSKTPKAEKRDSVDDTDNEDTPDKQMAATARKEAAAIKSLSAYEPEKQLKSADTSQIKAAMLKLAQEQQAKAEADRLRQKELAAVKVSSEDIIALVSEFEVDKKTAERLLREASGDLKQTVFKLLA